MKSPHEILLRHRVTEKAARLNTNLNQHVFEVAVTANRAEVAHAVFQHFKAKVARVNILNHPGKAKSGRMTGGYPGRTDRRKVAIVTLKEGQKIEMA